MEPTNPLKMRLFSYFSGMYFPPNQVLLQPEGERQLAYGGMGWAGSDSLFRTERGVFLHSFRIVGRWMAVFAPGTNSLTFFNVS